jgi:hypothetical protein
VTSSPRAIRTFTPALIVAAVATAIALTGCSQVAGVVEQVLPERFNVHTLVVGDCFNDTERILTSEDQVVDVPRENCTLEHDNEVIASIELEQAKFPSDEAVELAGTEKCLPEFEEFIGVTAAEAGTLAYDSFVPSAASWKLGDREILCFVYDTAAPSVYSLKGIGAERLATPPEGTEAEGAVEGES